MSRYLPTLPQLSRYATRQVVRRVVIVLVLAIISWSSVGRASAADCDISDTCNVQQAFAACSSDLPAANANPNIGSSSKPLLCKFSSGDGASSSGTVSIYRKNGGTISASSQYGYQGTYWFYSSCSSDATWDDSSNTCRFDCSQMADSVTTLTPPNGSFGCAANGCTVGYFYNGDGTSTTMPVGDFCSLNVFDRAEECRSMGSSGGGWYWNAALNVCSPVEPEECDEGVNSTGGQCTPPEQCPEGLITDANGLCKPEAQECPAGNIKSPDGSCLPGEGQCAAGEIRGADGTCKNDSNDDGQDDYEEGDPTTFSGGDSCDVPPQCSGDAIMCGQARIQWRIDCNTRRHVNISGGSCQQEPICVGEQCNAMEYAQLLQQWRTSCAVQSLLDKEGGANGEGGQPDWTRVDGMSQSITDGSSADDTEVWEESTIDGSSLDTGGWVGGGGSCPSFGFATSGGQYSSAFMEHIANPPPFWCSLIQWIYGFVLLSATVTGVYILGGRR